LTDVCEGVLSGQQVLDATRPSYAATLTYSDDSTTGLGVDVTYDGGAIVCHPAILAPPGSAAPDLPAHVEVEVTVGLTSDDGAFDESFTTLLDAFSPAAATFSERILEEDLTGTFDPELSDHTNVGVTFDATFMGASASGSLLKGGAPPSGGAHISPVGRWATPE